MIPKFPRSRSLKVGDKKDVADYISSFLPYSDFDFTSMWSWNTDQKFKISILNKNLVVQFSDYISGEPFFSFIGLSDVNDTIARIIAYAERKGIFAPVRLIPEEVAIKLDKSRFIVEEDRDNFDYVYSVQDLHGMKGSLFSDMRNQLSRTEKRHKGVKLSSLDLQNEDHVKQIRELFREWKNNKEEGLEAEKELLAIERLLILSKGRQARFSTVGVFDKEQLIAFAINELLRNGYAISHFVKANTSYAGIYAFVMHAMAKSLLSQDCQYLNYEQDLGLENLRYAKMCFRPVRFLKKYQVSVKK